MIKAFKDSSMHYCQVCESKTPYRIFAYNDKVIQPSAICLCSNCWERLKTIVDKVTAANSASTPLCEQFYFGCAVDGASCGSDGNESMCRQRRASGA
jgi:hypothetical protein